MARVARTCFYHLRRLRSIRRCLGHDVTARLVFRPRDLAVGLLQLSFGAFTGFNVGTAPESHQCCCSHGRGIWDHTITWTPALYELHWLPIAERIKFKLCLLVHHSINGRAPSYLTELVTSVANVPGRASLRSAGRHDLVVSAIKTGFVRASVFRCGAKSLEQSARRH